MTIIKKIGSKQWAMIVLSLVLAIGSLFIPLSDQITESPSLAIADASDTIPVPQRERSYQVRVAAPYYPSRNVNIWNSSI